MTTVFDDVQTLKFTWRIENASLWARHKSIWSPAFPVDFLDGSKWKVIWNAGDKAAETIEGSSPFRLCRNSGDKNGRDEREVAFRAGIVRNDATTSSKIIPSPRITQKEAIFKEPGVYLSNDTLTVECEMWSAARRPIDWDGSQRLVKHCSARTRIKKEEVTVVWKIKEFSLFTYGKEISTRVCPFSSRKPRFRAILSLPLVTEEASRHIRLEILNLRTDLAFNARCKASLVGSTGEIMLSHTSEHLFELGDVKWELPVLCTVRTLAENRGTCIPGDVLTVRMDFTISDGVEDSKLEGSCYEIVCWGGASQDTNQPSLVNSNFLSLFKSQRLCDVTLETSNGHIRTNRNIIAANSPVFSAMVGNNGSVFNRLTIPDVDQETTKRLLHYLYTGKVQELDWDSAILLHKAANRFQVEEVSTICSSFLRHNIDPLNVCQLLAHSYGEKDETLLKSAMIFFSDHKKDILRSDSWKALRRDSPSLALEVVECVCVM